MRPFANERASTGVSKLRRRLKLTGLALAVAFAAPIVLLHAFTFVISRHDRDMRVFESHRITNESGQAILYYELRQAGARYNLIFIHGTPATGAIFGEQFRRPPPDANLVTFDRPGFGKSTPAVRRPTLEAQVKAVGSFLGDNAPKNTIFVGHSYGAPVALLAALTYTNHAAGVVLIGGSVDPAQENIWPIQRLADNPLLSWLMPGAIRQCNRELLTLKGDLGKLERRLPELSVPVVMLHGGRDWQVPAANVRYLEERLVSSRKGELFHALIVPEFNHFIPWEHPEAVDTAIACVITNLVERNSPVARPINAKVQNMKK